MIVNIYSPTYHREEVTKQCFDALIPQIENSKHDVVLYIGDNNSGEPLVSYLKTLKSDKVKVGLCPKNLGKPNMVNSMHNSARKCDYVFSIDSDLIYDGETNFIDDMVDCMELMPMVGMLSSNQKVNCRHLWDEIKATRGTCITHKICLAEEHGVAGGCILMRTSDWDAIGGYCEHGKMYGFDDAIICRDVIRELNKKNAIIESTYFIHPFDADKEYADWKDKNILERPEQGFYD